MHVIDVPKQFFVQLLLFVKLYYPSFVNIFNVFQKDFLEKLEEKCLCSAKANTLVLYKEINIPFPLINDKNDVIFISIEE